MNLAFLDPAIFIWDVSDYIKNQGRYWAIASDVVELIGLVENCGVQVVARQEIVDRMIASFPAEHIDHSNPELRDFSTVIYGFLSRGNFGVQEFASPPIVSCAPDLINRQHFCEELKYEIHCALSFVFENASQFAIFSHEQIVGVSFISVNLVSAKEPLAVECFANAERYVEFRMRTARIYEENMKHDSLSGFGSKLPECLNESDLQGLLSEAMFTPNKNSLCIYSTKASAYIVFRNHFANRYHAYPVAENELSRIGVNSTQIPRH